MKTTKLTVFATLLTLFGTSALAADPEVLDTVKMANGESVHKVSAPVLLDANPYGLKRNDRAVVRVVKKKIDAPVARDASTAKNSQFVFTYGKKTKTKSFKPKKTNAKTMPNKFEK